MSYRLAEPVPASVQATLAAEHPLLAQLLYTRGLTSSEQIAAFLNPSYEDQLHDPFLLHQMDLAVERILHALCEHEQIVIMSDYDCDGIPGAVVLADFFAAVGHKQVAHVIPHRHFDGFGLSLSLVERIQSEHAPALVITVDCGTGDLEATERLNSLGIDLIVTDHHEPKVELPRAVAIVNPKLGQYPFPHLCGAAVAFKLAQAVLARGSFTLPAGTEKWWLDMVGIATIADMVPLCGENRVLARYGLTVLRKSRRPGVRQLVAAQRLRQEHLTEDDIGFTIGPRINAASRMDTPEAALSLLTTNDQEKASALAVRLETLNTARKTAGAQITRQLHDRLKDTVELPAVIVMGDPDWRPALVGLAATKLAEEQQRPVFLWGRDGNGTYKGSARSGGGVSVVRLMEAAPTLFSEFGGHHASGGFTVAPDRIHDVARMLNEASVLLGSAALREEYVVDAELTLDEIDATLLATQTRLAPFGAGNPKPLYALPRVTPATVAAFGKGREHTKLSFVTKGLAREAIAFFKTPEQFTVVPVADRPVTLLVHLEQSFFRERLETRLRIVDILPAA